MYSLIGFLGKRLFRAHNRLTKQISKDNMKRMAMGRADLKIVDQWHSGKFSNGGRVKYLPRAFALFDLALAISASFCGVHTISAEANKIRPPVTFPLLTCKVKDHRRRYQIVGKNATTSVVSYIQSLL